MMSNAEWCLLPLAVLSGIMLAWAVWGISRPLPDDFDGGRGGGGGSGSKSQQKKVVPEKVVEWENRKAGENHTKDKWVKKAFDFDGYDKGDFKNDKK